jgi:hypothetical protein
MGGGGGAAGYVDTYGRGGAGGAQVTLQRGGSLSPLRPGAGGAGRFSEGGAGDGGSVGGSIGGDSSASAGAGAGGGTSQRRQDRDSARRQRIQEQALALAAADTLREQQEMAALKQQEEEEEEKQEEEDARQRRMSAGAVGVTGGAGGGGGSVGGRSSSSLPSTAAAVVAAVSFAEERMYSPNGGPSRRQSRRQEVRRSMHVEDPAFFDNRGVGEIENYIGDDGFDGSDGEGDDADGLGDFVFSGRSAAGAGDREGVEFDKRDDDNDDSNEDDGEDEDMDDDMSFNTAEEMNTPMHQSFRLDNSVVYGDFPHQHSQQHGPNTHAKSTRKHRHPQHGRTPKASNEPVSAVEEAADEVADDAAPFDREAAVESLTQALLLGDSRAAQSVWDSFVAAVGAQTAAQQPLIGQEQASEILLHCLKEPSSLTQQQQATVALLALLVDTLCADVNHEEEDTGKLLLHYMVAQDQQALGRQLVRRGADVLHSDHSGTSALALSFSDKLHWVLEEFQICGAQDRLLQSQDRAEKFRYFACLVAAGQSETAAQVLNQGRMQVSADEASDLLNACSGNFANMEHPVETFELLESLGAKM